MVNLDSGYDIHAERAAPNALLSPSLWLGHVYLLVMNKQTWENLDNRDREAIQRAAITTEKALGKALDNNLISMVKTLEQERRTGSLFEKIRAGRLAESDRLSARANAVGRTAN